MADNANPFHVTFFNSLAPTKQLGTCPKCGQAGLDVRTSGRRGEKYVLHCGSCQPVLTGDALRVALQLIADRDADEAALAALADEESDATMLAFEARAGW